MIWRSAGVFYCQVFMWFKRYYSQYTLHNERYNSIIHEINSSSFIDETFSSGLHNVNIYVHGIEDYSLMIESVSMLLGFEETYQHTTILPNNNAAVGHWLKYLPFVFHIHLYDSGNYTRGVMVCLMNLTLVMTNNLVCFTCISYSFRSATHTELINMPIRVFMMLPLNLSYMGLVLVWPCNGGSRHNCCESEMTGILQSSETIWLL